VRLAVIVPMLDEAAGITPTLEALAAQRDADFDVFFVDNGSTDASAEVARSHGALVVTEPRRGFGSAAHAGLLAASAPLVAFCDADGSMDPADLPRVVDPVAAGDADLVLGRRRPSAAGAWPVHARLANALLAWRLRASLRLPIHDLGPMRAAHRVPLLALGLTDRRFGYPLEMIVAAARADWRVHEVDVAYAPRADGTRSKVTGTVLGTARAVRDMSKVLAR